MSLQRGSQVAGQIRLVVLSMQAGPSDKSPIESHIGSSWQASSRVFVAPLNLPQEGNCGWFLRDKGISAPSSVTHQHVRKSHCISAKEPFSLQWMVGAPAGCKSLSSWHLDNWDVVVVVVVVLVGSVKGSVVEASIDSPKTESTKFCSKDVSCSSPPSNFEMFSNNAPKIGICIIGLSKPYLLACCDSSISVILLISERRCSVPSVYDTINFQNKSVSWLIRRA